jgi:hypothetical protein
MRATHGAELFCVQAQQAYDTHRPDAIAIAR